MFEAIEKAAALKAPDLGDNLRSVLAGEIRAAWRGSIEAICNVGELLGKAKTELPHGQFEKMVDAELPFGARTARMLMAISKDARIRNHSSVLPTSWRTLYELTKLSDGQFEDAVRSGAVHAEMIKTDAIALAFTVTSAEVRAIKAARVMESLDWAFERDHEAINSFKESIPEYRMALEQCESFAAFREIAKHAIVEPQPGVIGAFAGFTLRIRDFLDMLADEVRSSINKKYHGDELVRVLAEYEPMEDEVNEAYRQFEECIEEHCGLAENAKLL